MPIERFFNASLKDNDKDGYLEGDEFIHASKVFRIKSGETFELINGKGVLALVEALEISKKHLSYKVLKIYSEPRHIPKLSLVLGMPKFNRLETIVEKVTEIGCEEIILFNADRSEKTDLSKNQLERLQLILQASLKQCGRLHLPSLEFVSNFDKIFESDRKYYFGDVNVQSHLRSIPHENVGIVIGPESGFSEKEHQILAKKAEGISLSDAILRTDTAAICGVFLLKNLSVIH
jgi:16S rRNA (uracil1498-N3)-methyltransferase